MLVIRKETPEDYAAVELLTKRAFWNIHSAGCNEHLLVRAIRKSEDYLPELSRVAELDGKPVGCIYYTKAKVVSDTQTHEVLTFGPLAVEPTCFAAGVGSALLNETIALAKAAGYAGIVITGEPKYYPKHGFQTCDLFGITDAEGNNYPALMCLPLNEDFSEIHGRLHESAVFENLGEAPENDGCGNQESFEKLQVRKGFYILYEKHIGKVQRVTGNEYDIRYWELLLKAECTKDLRRRPEPGEHVLFSWKPREMAVISEIIS